MPLSSIAGVTLLAPDPEFLDRHSAERRLIAQGSQEALCVSEAFSGIRCSAHYYCGALEAAWGLSGDDLLAEVQFALPKQIHQPLTIEVHGTVCGDGSFYADTLVDADGDRFLALERLSFLGFSTASAVCCSTFADVEWCYRRWVAGCFGKSELRTKGIIVRSASCDSPDSYAFGMN